MPLSFDALPMDILIGYPTLQDKVAELHFQDSEDKIIRKRLLCNQA